MTIHFNIEQAYLYYHEHINRTERFELLRNYNLSVAGSVPSIDWELFGAILTGLKRQSQYGADLGDFEVKSAVIGSSFEYQYHLHSGLQKLDEDKQVDHIFISYSKDYLEVVVRLVQGQELASIFEQWRPALIHTYQGDTRKQRFRKNITYNTVLKYGQVLMQINNGNLSSSIMDERSFG